VTQQNAALVEEAAAAAGSMQDQATALAEMVSIFKLRDDAVVRTSAPKRSAARVPASKKPVPRIAPTKASARLATQGANDNAEDWEQF
jgi:methyl-accepting chemotaxis protein